MTVYYYLEDREGQCLAIAPKLSLIGESGLLLEEAIEIKEFKSRKAASEYQATLENPSEWTVQTIVRTERKAKNE